jgi:thiamine kinase-like enzyme
VNVDEIIARIPAWAEADNLTAELIGGLTNTNYKIKVNNEKFILRISGKNTALLGINRDFELEALKVAAASNLGPQVVHYIQPEGHMVTKVIQGRHWTYEEYCQPENLVRMVSSVKAIHNLPVIQAEFSPFRRVEQYIGHASELEVQFPAGFDDAILKMGEIENSLKTDSTKFHGLCHNDLFALNFMDDGRLKFIDWEFAGMGDTFYDLATLAYTFDSVGEIPAELQDYVLECYFGEVNDTLRTRMQKMKFMVLLYAVNWGLLQYGLQRAGIVPEIDGFDFREYASYMFHVIQESKLV